MELARATAASESVGGVLRTSEALSSGCGAHGVLDA